MHIANKADRLELLNVRSLHTRVFHMSWLAFFLCFFAWFAIAPLMPVVREEFGLSKAEIGNTIIASVAITMLTRIVIGWLCDRIGPRITYSALLLLGSLPVMTIGFADDYHSFLLSRLAIGAIGASFVITQYHTTAFYAARCVGTANATSAGWGTLGGGVAQVVMPAVFSLFVGAGISAFYSWRLSMVVVGVLCAVVGVAYFLFTQDTPDGNFADLRARGRLRRKTDTRGGLIEVCSDKRVWLLFLTYGACFGVELTMHNMAALYFTDYFHLTLKEAGLMAGLFGVMNIFARSLGGLLGDRAGHRFGLKGRVNWLAAALLFEGLALMLFSRATGLAPAVGLLVVVSLCVQMSEGATFAIVPFVNPRAVGSVSGIVGAGGNAGAVAAGFLFKGDLPWPEAFLVLGAAVVLVASLVFLLRLSEAAQPRSSIPAMSDSIA
ncbi:MAG: MFS transporter [Polyangiaceae bacterium]